MLNKIQQEAVNNALVSLKSTNKALIRMATGTGKTNTALKLVIRLLKTQPKSRILWITHKNELIEQVIDRMAEYLGGHDIGIFNAHTKDFTAQLLVGSVQTISQSKYLKEFKKDEFEFIIVDECHHTPAGTWSKILEHFNTAKRIGLTATDIRPDGQTLDDLFGSRSYDLSFTKAQELDLLAKDESYLILTNSVLNSVTVTKEGDYTKSSLDKAFTSVERNAVILNSYLKYGRPINSMPKTIGFCISVNHAIMMTNLFRSRGILAEYVVGNVKIQNVANRKAVLDKFKNTNEIEVLFSVDIMTEGMDIPDVTCILMIRPTRSNILYQQQIGRGSRKHMGKHNFIVLDYVDNIQKEWQCYTMGNVKNSKVLKERIVTEFVVCDDPIIIEQRVLSVMQGIGEFENKFRKNWTFEKVKIEAKKYKIYGKFQKECWGGYNFARKNGYLEKICGHMKDKLNNWTIEKVIKLSLQCKTKNEFKKKHPLAYRAAVRKKFIDKVCTHMLIQKAHYRGRPVINKDTGVIYPSIKAAARSMGRKDAYLIICLKRGYKFGGYTFAYYE